MDSKIKPIILTEYNYNQGDIALIKNTYGVNYEIDIYNNQIRELFDIYNPNLKFTSSYNKEINNFVSNRIANKTIGDWIYFPWNKILIHSVNKSEYFILRTNRNKLIITDKEQEQLFNSCVSVIGLSVGSAIVESLVYTGIGNTLKISDKDTIAATNLNRMHSSIYDIGQQKVDFIIKKMYEINPYANIISFPNGIDENNISDFLLSKPIPKLIFEVIDDFKMKVLIRIHAKKSKIPLVMLTNLGDSVLIDIERYDINPDTQPFNNLVGKLTEEIMSSQITKEDEKNFAINIVDIENIPDRVLDTIQEIGKSLVGRPQINSTLSVSAGIASYLARQIILGSNLQSGRFKIELGKIFF